MTKYIWMTVLLVLLTAGAATAQKRYSNKELKFGFTYPTNLRLKTKDLGDSLTGKFRNVVGVWFGSTKQVGAMAVIATAAMTRAECNDFVMVANDPVKMRLGTITFEKQTDRVIGTESESQREIYRAYHGGLCYETMLEVSGHPRVGSKRRSRSMFNQLYPVLRTMYFTK